MGVASYAKTPLFGMVWFEEMVGETRSIKIPIKEFKTARSLAREESVVKNFKSVKESGKR